MEYIIIGVLAVLLIAVFIYLILKSKKPDGSKKETIEVKKENIETLAAYVQAQKEQAENEHMLREFKKAELKQKLETFRQTKEYLKDKLKSQIDEKSWKPLELILRSGDKGGTGIYILYNVTKNKYYVGQAKQLYKRVRDHFLVEDITLDYLSGDNIQVKFLTANELDNDYRLDHIEKTGIEIFESGNRGYNRTTGNL